MCKKIPEKLFRNRFRCSFFSGIRSDGEGTCKPGSVICRHLSADLHCCRPQAATADMTWAGPESLCFPVLSGVAPDRVYMNAALPRRRRALISAFPPLPESCSFGGISLLHLSGGFPRRALPVILPCGARTFLMREKARDPFADAAARLPPSERKRIITQIRKKVKL